MPDLLEPPAVAPAAPAPQTSRRPADPAEPRGRVSLAEFHRRRDAGEFPNDGAQTELLDGVLRQKPVPKPLHSVSVDIAAETIRDALPKGWRARLQDSVSVGESEPLPDIAVFPGKARDWLTRHPGPADLAVLIEVSDTTLALDRGRKLRIYAAAGVAPYWIVNLVHRRVEVYDEPTPGDGTDASPPDYRRRDFSPGETVSFRCGDVPVTLDVAELLPPAGSSDAER